MIVSKRSRRGHSRSLAKAATSSRRTKKERRLRAAQVYNGGRWSDLEKNQFLQGLKLYGPGQWKKIGTILTTRSNIQIKSHGQKIMQRVEKGEDVFNELEELSCPDYTSDNETEVSWSELIDEKCEEEVPTFSDKEAAVVMALYTMAMPPELKRTVTPPGFEEENMSESEGSICSL